MVTLCGGEEYDVKEKFCYNSSLYDLCGGKKYAPTTKFCYNDSIVDLCGGKKYELTQQFCSSGTLYDLCGEKSYVPTTQFCYNDSIVNLCGGKEYEITQQFCFDETLADFCGGMQYDLNLQFCRRDSIVDRCGKEPYDLDDQFCYNGSIVDFCSGEKYNPEQQFCFKGTLIDLCGVESYNPNTQFCDDRNGAAYRYTVIGGVTWMAENLDYKVLNSFCEDAADDDSPRCGGGKGRFYVWSAAMNRDEESCGYGKTCPLQDEIHQGVCPDGWHLPSEDEWKALVSVMGDSDVVYWDRSVKLYDRDGVTYGTDEFGFSAIPTGSVDVKPCESSGTTYCRRRNGTINPKGFDTWASTQVSDTRAALCVFYTDASWHQTVSVTRVNKNVSRTIRCVKNRGE